MRGWPGAGKTALQEDRTRCRTAGGLASLRSLPCGEGRAFGVCAWPVEGGTEKRAASEVIRNHTWLPSGSSSAPNPDGVVWGTTQMRPMASPLPPAPPEIVGQGTRVRGRTPGLPPRGGRARRRILVGTLAAMPAAWAVGVAAAADAAGLETQAPAGDAPSPCSSTNFVVADVGIEHLQSEGLASRGVPSSRRGSRAGRYRRSRRGAERRRWSRFPTSGAVRESTITRLEGGRQGRPRASGAPRRQDASTRRAGTVVACCARRAGPLAGGPRHVPPRRVTDAAGDQPGGGGTQPRTRHWAEPLTIHAPTPTRKRKRRSRWVNRRRTVAARVQWPTRRLSIDYMAVGRAQRFDRGAMEASSASPAQSR